jgi:hypothetical protein
MVFSTGDKKIIDERIERMEKEGKKAFFMNTPETEGTHYKTIFFITNIDFFLNNFKYLINEDVYNEEIKKVESNTNCLENFVYHSLKNKTEELLLEEINEDKLFSTSQINLFSLIEYSTILPLENDNEHFIVWFSSANSLDSRNFILNVKKNEKNIFIDIQNIDQKFIYYKKVKFKKGDIFEINFKTINEHEVLKDSTIIINDDVFSNIKSYGKFVDKKNILKSI